MRGIITMLLLVHSMKKLDFSALMTVYVEGNLENAQDLWPDESVGRQLQLAEEAFADYLRYEFFPVPGAIYCIWQENGCYCSALRLEPYRDGWLLEALETAPEYRRQGFALKLVQNVLRLPGYAVVYSHVHKKNTRSLALHKKCGFSIISRQATYIDGSINDRAFTLRYVR